MILTDSNALQSLSYGSKFQIDLRCDYCNQHFTREYRRHTEVKNNSNIDKDSCKKCLKIKNVEEFLHRINIGQTEEVINSLLINNTHVVSGIYSIRNIQNNKSYIGSSKDVIDRWKSHIIEMNNGNHYCEDFNYIDLNNLEFIILEINSDVDNLVNREYTYINLFKTNNVEYGYNIMSKTKKVKSNRKYSPMQIETKLKRTNFELSDIIEIKQLLADGIKINDVAKKFNAHYATIQSIKSCQTWKDVCSELNDILINIKYRDTHKGENNSCSKLTVDEVKEIKRLLNNSEKTMTEIAKDYNVSRTLIGHIKRGKLWSFVS